MGILGTADLFQVPLERESEEILESPVVEVKTSYAAEKGKSQGSRKRKREASPEFDEPRPRLTASDLVPLQQEVLYQLMAVFSEQLKLIGEQRAYYKLKREKLLNHSNAEEAHRSFYHDQLSIIYWLI